MTAVPSGKNTPAPSATPAAFEETRAVSHQEMDAAFARGEALLLNRSMPWLMRFRDSWWVVFNHGWIRIVDGLMSDDVENAAVRLTAAADIADAERAVKKE